MARNAGRPNDFTLDHELDDSQTIISAYQIRASRLQSRLLATLDALDTLQHQRASELQTLEAINERLTRQNRRLQHQLKLVEEEREDMKEAVSALVEKVEEMNGVDFLSRTRVSINEFIEPLAQDEGDNVEPPLPPPSTVFDHFSSTLFKALSEELTKEKEAHEMTRKDAATRIAVLQAQLARRDAELEAHVSPDSVPLLSSSALPSEPLGRQTITKSQAVAILDDAVKQNRKLEAEVQRLSQQLGKMRTKDPFQAVHLHVPESQNAPPPRQQVLADLEEQIRSAEVDAVELGTERMRLAYLDQISSENRITMEFDQVLLIEDECLRLRQVEQDLTSELRALRQQKATNEAGLLAEIEELQKQAPGPANVPPPVKAPSTQQGHPLIEVPSIPPPYVSPAQPALHGPPPSSNRPATPPRQSYNLLPSPPSSTHTVKPRNRRGSDSIARELLSAMEDVREKDLMLGRLKRELEELKARMLDEGSRL